MELNGWDEEGYRRRIRLLRRVLGMNQTQFAAHVGIDYKKWNHYECGYPVSRETAFMLRQKIDWFSADWLWHGDTRALPGGINGIRARRSRACGSEILRPAPRRCYLRRHCTCCSSQVPR
jgi:transcriptional regulator with XRE-family HTH domain